MMNSAIAALRHEQSESALNAEQMIERIDSHIRDLEQLKAWIRDSAKVRFDAIDDVIGKG